MKSLLIAALVFPLFGCATAPGPACPADFDAFLARFKEDPDFQQVFTAPVVVRTDAEAEANGREVVEQRVPRAKLNFPLMLNGREEVADKLETRIDREGASRAVYRVQVPESDAYVMDYTFVRDRCWRLVRIDDGSL